MCEKVYMYVSNWSEFGGSPGIGLYEFDKENGELIFIKMVNETISCGVTCVDLTKEVIYFANEVEKNPDMRAGGGGRIYSYRINPENGDLTEINHVDTLCPNPCYLSIDKNGEYMVAAHHSASNVATTVEKDENGNYYAKVTYSDATIALFRLEADGRIGEITDIVKQTGEGPTKKQLSAHPHSATRSPSGNLYGVVDKGNDTIRFYQIENSRLKPCECIHYLPAGSAPRYLLYHPTLPYFYVNHEMCMYIRSFRYTEEGDIKPVMEADARPTGFVPAPGPSGESQGFCMNAEGSLIYTTLHRPSMVAVMETKEDGCLVLRQNVEVQAEWPRCCVLSPDEKFLIVGCLKMGEIFVYRLREDGLLSEMVCSVKQPAPSALTFYKSLR